MIAVALALVWVGTLAWLAITQANPVTLNRDQVLRAELVVSARIDDIERGACTVEQQWGDDEPLSSISVANLRQTAAENGRAYILPLQHSRSDGFDVVEAHLPTRPFLVYPATDDALRQLQQLLGANR